MIMDDLLSKLIGQLGLNTKVSSTNASESSKSITVANSIHVTSFTSPSPLPVTSFMSPSPYYYVPPGPHSYPAQQFAPAQPFGYYMPPPLEYPPQPAQHLLPAQPGLTFHPAQPNAYVAHHPGTIVASPAGPTGTPRQDTILPHTFATGTLLDPTTGAWNMDTGASSHLNNSVASLSTAFNSCMFLTVSVGDGHYIPVTNTVHSILPTPFKSLHLNNVLITPHIVKNLISVRQFVLDNNCTIEFEAFGFSVKDFLTRRVLLRCDSTWDIYPVTAPSPIPHAFLVSQHTWHQHLGHPGGEVLRRLVSFNFISYNKEKPPVLCQLGRHVRLPFVSSSTVISFCFDIIHSDV
ncbi:hypothetical protein Tco_1030342 [Tanacetum coccineum]|uniref:Retrovirus-related Pol polyprotein from transposon TNT 1-94-like beta-barrel domain-containing protein n=1 Tax=Tanacetum coccineum TaxID=301880 RepID=A0ABQ5G5Y7_9ASTR